MRVSDLETPWEELLSAYGKATVGVIILLSGTAQRRFRLPAGDPHARTEESD